MEYYIKHNKSTKVCTVTVKGTHKRPEDSYTLQNLAKEIGVSKGCHRFCFDMRDAQITGTLTDIFEAGQIPFDKDHQQHLQRISLLFSELTEDNQFLENVAVNRGYQVRVFEDHEKLMVWLLK